MDRHGLVPYPVDTALKAVRRAGVLVGVVLFTLALSHQGDLCKTRVFD